METIIRPDAPFSLGIKELWARREIIYFFALRDIRLRYKHSLLGALWVVSQPFLTMLVLTFIFGRLTSLSTNHIPYPLFAFTGLLFWNFFSTSVSKTTDSLILNRSLITNAHFPKLILPLSSIAVGLVDFLFSFLLFIFLLIYYHREPNIFSFSLIIPTLFLTFLTSLGLGIFFSTLQVQYRGTRQVFSFLITMLFFLTPVIYPIQILPPHELFWLLYLNPLTSAIEVIRVAFFDQASLNWQGVTLSILSGIVLFVSSIIYFRKSEKELVDII